MKINYEENGKKTKLHELVKDATDMLLNRFEKMCECKETSIYEVTEIMDKIRGLKKAGYADNDSYLKGFQFDDSVEICWLEDICLYDPEETDSGEEELVSDIFKCIRIGELLISDPGICELEEDQYGKVRRSINGNVFSQRLWTGGVMPSIERRKAAKWEGIETL